MAKHNEPSAIYDARAICIIYDCGTNEIATLQKAGIIPPELAPGTTRKRRWSKAMVNKRLGHPVDADLTAQSPPQNLDLNQILELIRLEVKAALKNEAA